MTLKGSIFVLMVLSINSIMGQSAFPTKEWTAGTQKTFVLYLSGDGGFNEFSTGLCEAINKMGYPLTALNSKTYFWDRKTPEQTTYDVSSILEKQIAGGKYEKLVLIGYSFGADVMPFIVNRLKPLLTNKLSSVLLLSPSSSTDFEVHWSDFFGTNKKRSMDVVKEMNKMDVPKLVTLIGVNETHFPVKDIKTKNFSSLSLPGGHDFDRNSGEVAKALSKYF